MKVAAMALAIWMGICGVSAAETVELTSGDKLEGAVLERNDDYIVMEHPVLGRIKIPTDDIKPPEEEKVKPGLFGTSFLRGWDRSVSAGFNGASGKSKDRTGNVDLNVGREVKRHRSDLVVRYYYSWSDGDESDNEFEARYVHDFLFPPSKYFPFTLVHYTWDKFQDWDHRTGGNVGIGYQILKDETFNIVGRVGGGAAQTLGGGEERTEISGLLALETKWIPMEKMTLTWKTAYAPNFNDLPNFRLESRAEWKIAIGFVEGLAFKLGGSYTYDGHETNRSRNDRKYYANLVYDF